MAETQTTIIPHSQQPLVTRTYPSEAELSTLIERSAAAQRTWAKVPQQERIAIVKRGVEELASGSNEIPLELTVQMGRPVSQGAGELRGFLERANWLLDAAPGCLADVSLAESDKPGFRRYIKRVPLGVVLVVAPWNYPYLVTVNSVIPALLAGNSVLLKPSPQTPLAAERLAAAFTRAGLPTDVLQVLHLSPALTAHAVQHPRVAFTSFTGSVPAGRAVAQAAAAAPGLPGVALELGGKDPAYVRAGASLAYTVAELVDGALFNSGQSCCAVERIYVHESLFEPFVAQFVELVKQYKLGDPTQPGTNLGPVVSVASAERIRKQVADAVKQGAKALIPEELFPEAKPGTAYVAPQVLVNVDHKMGVMTEESFGPIVGIMKVSSDEEAVALMNDSPYGLTASVWTDAEHNTESAAAFERLVDELEAGTVYLNRADYLDPALAWTGYKNSGRGISLSKFGFDQLTKAKSVHMKIKTA